MQNDHTQILDAITNDLYRRAAGHEPQVKLPVRFIDSPSIAQAIFRQPDLFIKNYGFLESLSKGRFSANGDEWKIRASLTQAFYSRSNELLSDTTIKQIYRRHIKAYIEQRTEQPADIFQTLINASIEIISVNFKLNQTIPWPTPLIKKIRSILKAQQCIAWGYAPEKEFEQNRQALAVLFCEIQQLWEKSPEIMALLNQWQASASTIEHFNPVGEFIQNLIAAGESTATTLLWAIDQLARNQQLQLDLTHQQLTSEQTERNRTLFIQELLRLFPPIAFVTRVCLQPTEIEGITFLQGEPIVISIVGIHCHKNYWSEPLSFKHSRQEFVTDSYARNAYIPFLSGARVCGGMKLAIREVSLGLNELLDHFTISECFEPLKVSSGLTSRPGIKLDSYLKAKLQYIV